MITKFNLTNRTIISYAIRKLTAKECFRLMGVPDETISKMQQTRKRMRNIMNADTGKKEPHEVEEQCISYSQQYKQAGNSIVTNALKSLYTCMFRPDEVNRVMEMQALSPTPTLPSREGAVAHEDASRPLTAPIAKKQKPESKFMQLSLFDF